MKEPMKLYQLLDVFSFNMKVEIILSNQLGYIAQGTIGEILYNIEKEITNKIVVSVYLKKNSNIVIILDGRVKNESSYT